MKIDLITYSRTRNYGGILQAYGLYRYLELTGYDVSFIDYIPPRCNIQNRAVFVEEAVRKSRIWGMNRLTKAAFSMLCYPAVREAFQPFLAFLDQRAEFTKPYYSIEELNRDIPIADIYITGSDQVWNSQFSREQRLDLPFYLPFVQKGIKISYASSFGRGCIPEHDRETVRKLLSSYHAVSVREPSGKTLLAQLGIAAETTVDPTILCPLSEWEDLAGRRLEHRYFLLYQVGFSREISELAQAAAKKAGKKLLTVTLDRRRNFGPGIRAAVPVEDWLSYIRYADGVITDSFHACVFSILFRVPFLVNSGTRKELSARIGSLLEISALDSLCENSFELKTVLRILNGQPDWEEAHRRLKIQREKSIRWLSRALGT